MEAQRGSTICLGGLKRQQSREKKAETFKEFWVQIVPGPFISQQPWASCLSSLSLILPIC